MVVVAGCVALMITAMVSILEREFVPAAPIAATPLKPGEGIAPSPNADGKRDKLPVAERPPPRADIGEALPGEPLRQAYAADSPYVEPGEPIAGPIPMPRARMGGRPVVQKNYTLLSDIQIAAIKSRLRLTAAQETLWPDVEKALRALARSMHDKRQAGAAFEAGSAEVEQLKTAAQPLIAQLREDQKREVRSLARLIGLEAVAGQI